MVGTQKAKAQIALVCMLAVVLTAGLAATPALAQSPLTIGGQATSLSVSNPRIVADDTMNSGQVVTWDCVWFGSYPQTEITSSDAVYASLQSADWDDNTDGGNCDDATVAGVRYRRFAEYDETGEDDSPTYRYFRFEPIKWRVLSVSGTTAFVLADKALSVRSYYGSRKSITWKFCEMRSWLNGRSNSITSIAWSDQPYGNLSTLSFITAAFSEDEYAAIPATAVVNADNLTEGTEGGVDTSDKIFLLSESETWGAYASDYGFAGNRNIEDEARRCKATDYATAIGAKGLIDSSYPDNCNWWLRSPGFQENSACMAYDSGSVGYTDPVNAEYASVRPALSLDLSSSCPTYAGTVSSAEAVDETAPTGTYGKPASRESIAGASVSVAKATYDGNMKEPAVTVKLGTKTLTEGTDYTVTYSNNVNASSEAVAKVTGIGNYKDSVSKKFTIAKHPMDKESVTAELEKDSYPWTGKAIKPKIKVYFNGKLMKEGTDYKVSYLSNKNIGEGTIEVTGMGNFTSTTRLFGFKIVKAPITLKLGYKSLTKTYADKGKSFPIKVTPSKSSTLSYKTSNKKVATAKGKKITITGKPGKATITITAKPKDKHYASKSATVTVTVLKKQTVKIKGLGKYDSKKGQYNVEYTKAKLPIKAVASGKGKLSYRNTDKNGKAYKSKIATIDKDGNITFTGKAVGTVYFTVKAAATDTRAPCAQTVKINVKKSSPTIKAGNITLMLNETRSIGATTNGNGKLTYKIADKGGTSITVDKNGAIKAGTKAGTAKITVSAGATATCNAAKSVDITVKVVSISLNDPSIYLKQEPGSSNCTLYALANMMRRKAILDGRSDWKKIGNGIEDPTSAFAEAAWKQGDGLKGTIKYEFAKKYTLNAASESFLTQEEKDAKPSAKDKTRLVKERLIALLKDHPEGIECYDTGLPHAVLVTSYDADKDTFYCSDSGLLTKKGKGIVKLSESSLGMAHGDSQNSVLAAFGKYWYLK